MRKTRGNAVWKMTRRTTIAVCVFGVFLSQCASEDTPKSEPQTAAPTETKSPPAPRKQLPVPSQQIPADAPASPVVDAEEGLLKENKIIAVTLLSPRSLSMKLKLEGGAQAVFKPIRKDDRRATYETAAYKIAKHLQIAKVPVSVVREIPLAFLMNRLKIDNAEAAQMLQEAVPKSNNGTVTGAMIEWMEDIDPNGLAAIGGMKAVNKMLSPGRPDDGKSPLAQEASAMVVFDHIIGNWDRFSGGNFFVAEDKAHLVLIDHNGSFIPWPEKRQARMEKRLTQTERFSASLLDRIRELTPAFVQKAVRAGDANRPLLKDDEINLLLSRRDEVVRHVNTLIEKNGMSNTVVFP